MASEDTGVLLRSLDGTTFHFDPGALCLAFAVTGGEEDLTDYETLHRPGDLAEWAQSTLGVLLPSVTGRDLKEAKLLRGALWRLADARVEGRQLAGADAGTVNRHAAKRPLVPQIDGDGRRVLATPATAAQLTATVARDAVDLFTGPLADRIRRCAGTNCTLVFADTSRPGRRRWCSMDRCGNRAKVTTFRQRQRTEDPP